MTVLAGLDIGGTKCAVSLGEIKDGSIEVIAKEKFPTPEAPEAAIRLMEQALEKLLDDHPDVTIASIGISCGNPLDSKRGLILSPPNLPNWHEVDIVTPFKKKFGVEVALQNDANACALAEWKWGAGKGNRNVVFLTFGTGMGAGLILNGQLYSGTNDFAGEVGHMRLENYGPAGYGKNGSFEGFCSGGGIAKYAQMKAEGALQVGQVPSFCRSSEELNDITTKKVGEAAQEGDPLALEIFEDVAGFLGRGLAVIIDLFNPEKVIIGSIYGRQQALLEPIVKKTVRKEALSQSLAVCEIVPGALGESIGDFACLSVALNALDE
ncbi:MAG TPA: ROK family protein [Bacillales bacterium]|nr:ROK family protein [Bacillales bacterium]